MKHIFEHISCHGKIKEARNAQHIKQANNPFRVLLVDISKVYHQQEDAPEIADTDIVYQIAEVHAILVVRGGCLHIFDVANYHEGHQGGQSQQKDCHYRILHYITENTGYFHIFYRFNVVIYRFSICKGI